MNKTNVPDEVRKRFREDDGYSITKLSQKTAETFIGEQYRSGIIVDGTRWEDWNIFSFGKGYQFFYVETTTRSAMIILYCKVEWMNNETTPRIEVLVSGSKIHVESLLFKSSKSVLSILKESIKHLPSLSYLSWAFPGMFKVAS